MKHQLDVRKLLCPIPVIRTQNKVKELAEGDELEVIATDPGALNDIPSWCRINGHDVLDYGDSETAGEVFVLLRVGEKADSIYL